MASKDVRFGMDARQRMAAQTSQADKVAQADYVIANDGTVAQLYAQLDELWEHVGAKVGQS